MKTVTAAPAIFDFLPALGNTIAGGAVAIIVIFAALMVGVSVLHTHLGTRNGR